MVTLTRHVSKYKVRKLHERYILKKNAPQWHVYHTLHFRNTR